MLSGTIKKLIYQNKDYIVAILDGPGDLKISGVLPGAAQGQKVTLFGEYQNHSKYGRHYVFSNYKTEDMQSYFTSGLVKGIGVSLAAKIVKEFPDPLNIILNSPLRLVCVDGISEKKALSIAQSVKETLKYKDTAINLAPCDLTPNAIIKIHHHIKDPLEILKNPYLLTEIEGIGFVKADNIAQKLNIKPDSPQRIQAAAYHELKRTAYEEGHVFYPEKELAIRTFKTLNEKIKPLVIEENIKKLNCIRDGTDLYLPNMQEAENSIAAFFKNFKAPPELDVAAHLSGYEIALSPSQKEAVEKAFKHGILIITGGPGTGKTETVRAITKIFRKTSHRDVILAAPTGRASRRMSEMVGIDASTIHRLIASGQTIDAGMIIVDEASMVDVELFARLLRHVQPETRLIFVGDPDQLPPVGPGQVLQDIIGVLPTVSLTQIFRQAESSDIIINAHKINKGDINIRTGKDFYFVEKESPEDIRGVIKSYAARYFAKKNTLDGLQVLSPMKKGDLGTIELNAILQEIATGTQNGYNIGDRIVQLRNNYDKSVFNGEIGKVVSLNPLKVKFESREVNYKDYERDQITLAYAITVHKSQGSEFPVVLIPLSHQHYVMLERKILYTAITRAKRQVVLISNYKALNITLRNLNYKNRFSKLNKKMLDSST